MGLGGQCLGLVRTPGIRVSRLGPVLADPSDAWACRMGCDFVPRLAWPPCGRQPRQHAMALLLFGAIDPGVLRGRFVGPSCLALYYHRFLEVLGGTPLG